MHAYVYIYIFIYASQVNTQAVVKCCNVLSVCRSLRRLGVEVGLKETLLLCIKCPAPRGPLQPDTMEHCPGKVDICKSCGQVEWARSPCSCLARSFGALQLVQRRPLLESARQKNGKC